MCIIGDVLFRRTFQPAPSFFLQVPIWSVPWSAHHNLSPKRYNTKQDAQHSFKTRPEPLKSPQPQLQTIFKGTHIYIYISLNSPYIHTVLAKMNIFWTPTHDSQSSSLGQLSLYPLKHFQFRAVQFTAVDGAVP